VKPELKSLLIADHVYVDSVTNKKIVAGVFHEMYFTRRKEVEQTNTETGKVKINVAPGGMQASSPFAYIALTEVKGQQEFELRYVRLKDDKQFFGTTFQVDCPDPLVVVEVVLALPILPANEPGVHALELLWNQEPLGSCRITVREKREGEAENE